MYRKETIKMNKQIESVSKRIQKINESVEKENSKTATLKTEKQKQQNILKINKYQDKLIVLNNKLLSLQEKQDYKQKNVTDHCDLCNNSYKRIMAHMKSKKHCKNLQVKEEKEQEQLKKKQIEVSLSQERQQIQETISTGIIPQYSDLYKYILIFGVNANDDDIAIEQLQEREQIVINCGGFTDEAIKQLVVHKLMIQVKTSAILNKTTIEKEMWYCDYWRSSTVNHIKEYQMKQGCFDKQYVQRYDRLTAQ